jgi:hypothetical protein
VVIPIKTDETFSSPARLRVLVLIAAIVASSLLLIAGCGDDNSSTTDSTAETAAIPVQGPTEVTADELRALAEKQTIYWSGEIPDTKLELTVTDSGNVFVRYLPEDAEIGTTRPALTVSTYPAASAYELLQAEAQKTGAPTEQLEGGGLVMVDKKAPTNVYLAYPGSDFQVEVYDHSPDESLGRIMTGDVEPVS